MHKNKITLILLLLTIGVAESVFAQDRMYYSSAAWSGRSNKKTEFKRVVAKGEYLQFTDYYKDTLSAEITFTENIRLTLGEAYASFIKGNMQNAFYKEDYKDLSTEYTKYNNGEVSFRSRCSDKSMKYYEVYDQEGNQVLDGTCSGKMINEERTETIYMIYRDSLLVENYGVRKNIGDTIYYKFDKMAQPSYGYQKFYTKMRSVLKYPFTSRIAGQEDTFYVQFIVDENGELRDFECLNSSVPKFENRTLQQLKKIENWEPAELNGKFVKSKYVLPFVFRLRN